MTWYLYRKTDGALYWSGQAPCYCTDIFIAWRISDKIPDSIAPYQ